MDVKVYQAYYHPNQVQFLDPNFIHYNNQQGNKDLLEYEIWKQLFLKHAHTSDYWGVLSWRWQEKINLPGHLLKNWIESNPDYDVYFVNPYNWIISIKNLWIQGEGNHPGIINWCNLLLNKLNVNCSIENIEYTVDEYCTCHYFIGNAKFWKTYLDWLDNVIAITRADPELNQLMFIDKCLHRGVPVSYFPFLIERLFTIFCILNQNIKVKSFPYDSFAYPRDENLLNYYYDKKKRTNQILTERLDIVNKLI